MLTNRKHISLEQAVNDASKTAYTPPLTIIIAISLFAILCFVLEEQTHATIFMLLVVGAIFAALFAPIFMFKKYIKKFKVSEFN